MAKKNFINPEKSSKVSSPSAAALTTAGDIESLEKVPECELSKEERRELFEKYQLTGEFEKDFTELSSFLGFQIAVTHRARLPSIPLPESVVSKSKDDKKNQNCSALETPKISENEEILPTTYVINTDKYEFFKPHVEIDSEGEVNKECIKSLHFRGWKVDSDIINVLSLTLPGLEHLTSITLWNVGLRDETLSLLWECLSSSASLKKLCLDGNNYVSSQKFDLFLSQTEKLCLQNLSLRNCNLNETGALYIRNALTDNKNLLSLNLCFNQLGSAGAKHLADGLRFNRTLLSLNVGSNGIDDDGAKYISEALSTFPLSHDQVVARRMQQSSYFSSESSGRSSSQERPHSTTRSNHSERKSREKSFAKKKDASLNKGKEVTIKRDKSNSDTTKGPKGPKPKSSVKVERNKSPFPDMEDSYDSKDPLLEKVRELDGELWIPGNRALINLNLSRNDISEVGLEKLYSAMKFQVELAHETNRVVGTGLMRLSLERNRFPPDHAMYLMLTELMTRRDPFYKSPSIEPIEENT